MRHLKNFFFPALDINYFVPISFQYEQVRSNKYASEVKDLDRIAERNLSYL